LAYKKDYALLSEGLKKLTYNTVSRSPDNMLYELRGEKIITGLYQVYMDKKFNKNMKLLPAEYRYMNPSCKKWERSVIDYISGMMDQYAIYKYKEFFGQSSLDKIL
jgi:dGTPase